VVNVVVTGGASVAPIDDVRSITNLSSGRFAATITEACLERSAAVWHLHTPSAQLPYRRLATFDLDTKDPAAETARLTQLRERAAAVRDRLQLVSLQQGTVSEYACRLETLLKSQPIDIAFLAMAVADFEPDPYPGKLDSRSNELLVRCRPARKVIQSVRDWSPEIYLVGFKLLSRVPQETLIRQAEDACRINRANLTVANNLQPLRAGRHTIHLVRPDEPPETFGPPEPIAERLVDRVLKWAAESRRP
jgi:phosphopantothenate-cysteine ligase